MNPKKRIGDLLLEAGIIDETQLKAALGHQRRWGVRLGQALVDLKLAAESDIVRALSLKFGFEVANLSALEPYGHEQAVKLFPREFAVRNNVFPMWADTANVTVAMSDPSNLALTDEIRFRTGRRVKVCIGGDREIAEALRRRYPPEGGHVEAIALDLDADAGAVGEAVFDPFGGGFKDALDAFFSGEPAPAPAHDQAAPVAAKPAERRPAPQPSNAAAPVAAAVPTGQSSDTPAAAARPTVRARSPLAHLADAAPGAMRPQVPAPVNSRQSSPATPRAPSATPVPAPAALAGGRPKTMELELEAAPRSSAEEALDYDALNDLQVEELTPLDEVPQNEPFVPSESASEVGKPSEDTQAPRELSARELAILESLDRLAGGAPAEPEIVKPTQAMAAMIRLLLHKRIVSEQEFLDELSRK